MKPRILLVDDREDNLLSIEAILKQDGYEFTMAYSGTEALKVLSKESDFAMILMDVKMPILSGFETATLIYERDSLKQIPIIFITANYYGEENLFKGYQSGGIDYIFKPINPEVLRAKVSIFIDLYRKNALLIEQDQKLLEINKDLAEEITRLKASEEKLKLSNRELKKKIAEMESLMAVSNIPVEKSEFVNSDLNILVKGLLSDMQEEFKTTTISVGQLPSLNISPRLIRPLFRKLISNALSHRAKDTDQVINIHAEVSPELSEEKRNGDDRMYCRIFVEDNCHESPENLTGDICEEFCDSETGISVYQKILEHHNGHITAKSKVNEGLTYIISLPMENHHGN